jgi:hypothetical protein
MYVLIDRDRMIVVCRHPSHDVLVNLEFIQFAHMHSMVFEDSDPGCLEYLSTVEMLRLYTSLTGKVFPGFDRGPLGKELFSLIARIPPVVVNPLLVLSQASSISFGDTGFYQYNPLSHLPTPAKEALAPKALLPGDAPIINSTPIFVAPPPVVKSQQSGGENKYPPPWS